MRFLFCYSPYFLEKGFQNSPLISQCFLKTKTPLLPVQEYQIKKPLNIRTTAQLIIHTFTISIDEFINDDAKIFLKEYIN